jgi:AcrR family transcriptional regulator
MEVAIGRGQRTREALCRAAVALVAERGWGGASTRLVAERAGVPPGTVHYHFASLPDLLIDATAPLLGRITDEAVAALDAAPDLPAGVDWLLGVVARYSADPAALRLPGEVLLAGTRHERLGREIAAMLARFRAGLAGWLARCGRAGDAEAVAMLLAAALDGLLLHRAVDPAVEPAVLIGVLRRLLDPGSAAAATAVERSA